MSSFAGVAFVFALFSWLPAGWLALVSAAFGILGLILLAKLLKLILDALPIL